MRRGAGFRWAIVGSVVAVVGALLSAASTAAAWTPYVNLVKQQDVESPLVEMDQAGDTIFAWRQGTDSGGTAIFTRERTAAGTRTPIRRIGSTFGRFDFAVDPQGNAYYVWSALDSAGRGQLRTRVRFADGTLSPVQRLKTAGKGEFIAATVGVDASGTAVYAWDQRQDDRQLDVLQARTRSPSGALGAVHDIGRGYLLDWGDGADMAVDASGNTTFAWVKGATPDDGWVHVFTRVLNADGSLEPVTEVSRSGRPGSDPQVVVAPSGRALFGWEEFDRPSGAVNLLVRARSAGGAFEPPQILAKTDDLAPLARLELGITAAGEGVIAWPTDNALYARTRAPGGALGARKTIAATATRDSDLGIDSQGNVVFAWTPSTTDGEKARAFARTEDASGALSPIRALSLAGYNAYSPDVSVSSAGDAAVGWQEGRSGFAIQASFGP